MPQEGGRSGKPACPVSPAEAQAAGHSQDGSGPTQENIQGNTKKDTAAGLDARSTAQGEQTSAGKAAEVYTQTQQISTAAQSTERIASTRLGIQATCRDHPSERDRSESAVDFQEGKPRTAVISGKGATGSSKTAVWHSEVGSANGTDLAQMPASLRTPRAGNPTESQASLHSPRSGTGSSTQHGERALDTPGALIDPGNGNSVFDSSRAAAATQEAVQQQGACAPQGGGQQRAAYAAPHSEAGAAPCTETGAAGKNSKDERGQPVLLARAGLCLSEAPQLTLLARLTVGSETRRVKVMIDSGATGNVISQRAVQFYGLQTLTRTSDPVSASTVDDSTITSTSILPGAKLHLGKHTSTLNLTVLPISQDYDILLGTPWLRFYNPSIDWETGMITLKTARGHSSTITAADYRRPDHPLLISALQFKRLSRKGAETYLCVLKQKADQPAHLPPEGDPARATIERVLKDYENSVFLTKPPTELPPEERETYKIDMVPDHSPPHRSPYRMSKPELDELERQLQELLAKKYIVPSESSYAAPVLFAKKGDGSLRLCIDYRELNRLTIRNSYPLPDIPTMIDNIGTKGKYMTRLDLVQAYHQFRIHPDHVPRTAMNTPLGQFSWIVLPFGLRNAPSFFSAALQRRFRHLIGRCLALFIDDLLIYSPTLEQHEKDLREVLDILKSEKFYCKLSKCEFGKQELDFLGYTISATKGIRVSDKHLEAVKNWQPPTTVHQLRQFLGMANFHRRFIRRYSHIAAPLTDLLRKEQTFNWTAEAQRAFEALQEALTSAPVVISPDYSKPFVIFTDASENEMAIGAALMQDHGKGLQPIAYLSRKLTSAEQN